MLDDLYQADTDAAIRDLQVRPPAPRAESAKFSAWRMLTGAPRGVAAGGGEAAGGWADVLGAFGQAAATTYTGDLLGNQTEQQRKETDAARQKMLKDGLEFDQGDSMRTWSRQFMPDPATAHTAEQVTFGLFRFGSKAVGYSVMGGPAVGAGLTGLDEALTAADELKRQGVDPLTRMEVGAVAGVASAAGVALPVAGKTAVQTAALVAAGGPGAFIGQQAATRQILQSAGYDDVAMQYDPFDPVGLAVATLVPAGFGAFALRGAARRARVKAGDGPAEVAPAMAEARAEPGTAPDSVQTEPVRPTREQADAARVEMLSQHMEQSGLFKPEDARAAAQHVEAFARAMDNLGSGRRVDVTDLVPVERLEVARALDTFSRGLETARTELVTQAAMRADPGVVRQMQGELVDAQARLVELEDPAAIKQRAAELQQTERLSYKEAAKQARKEFSAMADDVRARVARLESQLEDNATATQAIDALGRLDQQAEQVRQQRAVVDAPGTKPTATAAAAKETASTTTPKGPAADAAPTAQQGQAGSPAATQGAKAAQPATADAGRPGAQPGEGSGPGAGSAGAAAEAGLVAQRLADIQQQFPDLAVQMDGMDGPVPLADFLAQVQREAMEGTDFDLGGNDAPLMQVAATCFLLNG